MVDVRFKKDLVANDEQQLNIRLDARLVQETFGHNSVNLYLVSMRGSFLKAIGALL